jgi:hypothetical protein
MNDVGIFIAGALVTIVVAFALIIVIWGAVMDGRSQEPPEVTVRATDTSPARVTEMRGNAPDATAPGHPPVRMELTEIEPARMWYPG